MRLASKDGIALAVITVGLFLTAFHLGAYAYEDDYFQLLLLRWSPFSWWNNDMAAEGRPLYGLILYLGWQLLGSTEHAIWFRVFGIVGFILTALTVFLMCRQRWKLSTVSSACLAVFILLTTAMAVCTFWAAAGPHAWSALLGLLAGWGSLRSWEQTRPRQGPLVLSTALLLAAETVYQPMAGFFLLPLSMEIVLRGDRAAIFRTLRVLAHFGVVLIIYLMAYKAASATVFADNARVERAGSLGSLIENTVFYVANVLPFVVTGWAFLVSWQWALFAKIAVMIGTSAWTVCQVFRNGGINAFLGVGVILLLWWRREHLWPLQGPMLPTARSPFRQPF